MATFAQRYIYAFDGAKLSGMKIDDRTFKWSAPEATTTRQVVLMSRVGIPGPSSVSVRMVMSPQGRLNIDLSFKLIHIIVAIAV